MRELTIYNDVIIKVDDEDYEMLSSHNWCLNNSGYPYRTTKKSEKDEWETSHILMHRFILGVKDSTLIVDHANGDPLDNQRSNLRIVNKSQNGMNSTQFRANNTSGYKGVYYRKDRHKFQAYIEKDKKRRWLGCYKTAEEAARVYNMNAIELFGEYALLNEI